MRTQALLPLSADGFLLLLLQMTCAPFTGGPVTKLEVTWYPT